MNKEQPIELSLGEAIRLLPWTAKELSATRKRLGLTQKDVADFLNVTKESVSNVEREITTSPMFIQIYGIILERYYAAINGYVPAYRKIGETEFITEGAVVDFCKAKEVKS